jgi:Uma2 family endonuclease
MALPQEKIKIRYSEEEYLAFERESDIRHEYIDGEIFEMAGESEEHGEISGNFFGELYIQLKGSSCRARVKDTKVRSGPRPNLNDKRKSKGLFSYPDVVVICGEPIYLDDYKDVVLNPRVIIEVLSPSTADFDLHEKFMRYQSYCPSMNDYILVRQNAPLIEHYMRREGGGWIYFNYQGLESSFTIESINCTLKLADIYARIKFPSQEKRSKAQKSKTKKSVR